MIRRTTLIGVIGLIIAGCTPDDSSSPAPEDVFVKYYGSDNSETVVDLHAYQDGYILYGSTNVNGDTDLMVVRIDASGNEIERKTIGGEDGSEEVPSRMIIYNDGVSDIGALVGTTTFRYAGNNKTITRIFVSNINPQDLGATESSKVYPVVPDAASVTVNDDLLDSLAQFNSEGFDLIRAPGENAYIVIGSTEDVVDKSPGIAESNTKDMYLVKISNDLRDNFIWVRRFGFDGEDVGIRLTNTSSNLFLLGSTEQSLGGEDGVNVLYVPLDLDGLGDARNIYGTGGNNNDVPTDVILSGNRLVVVGSSQSAQDNSFIMSIPTSGGEPIFKEVVDDATLSRSTSDTDGNNEAFTGNSLQGITQLLNGNFMVVGRANSYTDITGVNKNREMLFAVTDQFGRIDSTKVQTYGGIGNDVGNAVIQNVDGSLAIGATTDFQGGATMMTLIKTNSSGEIIQ